MNQQRSRIPKPGAFLQLKGKSFIAATMILAVGLIAVAVGHGILWAVAFASVSAVLLLQLAISWKQARLDTERFQQLRNRLDKLSKHVAKIEGDAGTTRAASMGRSASATATEYSPSGSALAGSSQQMFELQRELDYLLWRVSSARTDPGASAYSPTETLQDGEHR